MSCLTILTCNILGLMREENENEKERKRRRERTGGGVQISKGINHPAYQQRDIQESSPDKQQSSAQPHHSGV
jgi:hypothetical protein